jgi:GntR family transcriptional repressor for pyruvate dehydrogenase complex
MREAFSVLETLGMIESRSGQGNFIKSDPSQFSIDGGFVKSLLMEHDPFEIYETRLEVEPSMAAYAAERATEEEKSRLRTQVELLNSLGDKLESDRSFFEDYMEEDRKFHLFVGRAAHNNVLFLVFSAVNLMMTEELWKEVKSKGVLKEGNLAVYRTEHTQICDSICKGRSGDARLYMRKHILDIREDLFDAPAEVI